MLLKKRSNVHDLTVFGAGKQAYWHIRIALLLRGPDIHHLNIINRNFDNATSLVKKLYDAQSCPNLKPGHPYIEVSRPNIQILTPSHGEYGRLLKNTVRGASVIFCTTPSLSPLFPASYLTNNEGRKKGRYIAAIGSYKPHMIELHPDILRQAVTPEHHHHHHKHAKSGGAIIVDSVEACLKEAGEVIQAGLAGHEVVEIGELVMLKRDAEARRKAALTRGSSESSLDSAGVELGDSGKKKQNGSKGSDGSTHDATDKGLKEWLERGNVIYKSVGLGLMDMVVGVELVRLADERGIGTRIESF
jgi:ornithine cyclodeaminase/alanine dehydrogenase-like protein (mu-crystallin family)